jgi:hypothetical protein
MSDLPLSATATWAQEDDLDELVAQALGGRVETVYGSVKQVVLDQGVDT